MKVKTERLILVPVTQKYTSEIFENFTEEVTTFMYPCPAKEIKETEKVVDNWIKDRVNETDFVYAITLEKTSEFIGIVGLHDLKRDIPELGIWTKVTSQGNHYGREAIGGLIEFAKNLGFKKLLYPVDRNNVASKKIPLYYGGILAESNKLITTPDGRVLDEEIYLIAL